MSIHLTDAAGDRVQAILQLAARGEHLRALLFELRAPLDHLLAGVVERAAASDLHAREQHTRENCEHRGDGHRQCKRTAELDLAGPPVPLGEDDDIHALNLLPSITSPPYRSQ